MPEQRVFVQTRLDKDIAKRFRAKAKAENRSVSDYLRLLITAHVRPTTGNDGK